MRASIFGLVLITGCTAAPDDQEWWALPPYCVLEAPSVPVLGDGPPDIDGLCRAIAARVCEQWARCGCDDGSGSVERTACEASVQVICARYVGHPDVRDAVARGTLVWSEPEAERFRLALADATAGCEPVDLDVSHVLLGSIVDDAPCTDISGAFTECTDGSSCQVPGTHHERPPRSCQPDSVSAPHQGRGERCNVRIGCEPNLRCAPRCDEDGEAGVCVPLLLDGEPCRPGECESGHCMLEPGTPPTWTDTVGQCVTPGPGVAGDPCTYDSSCVGWCDTSDALEADTSGHCVDGSPSGSDCVSARTCVTGACTGFRRVPVLRCRETDEPCVTSRAGCECVPYEEIGTCTAPGEAGSSCRQGDSCRSGECVRYECTALEPVIGDPCDTVSPCVEGVCIDDTCRSTHVEIGERCSDHRECVTGACLGRTCAPAACVTRIDPTGHGIFWLVPPLLTPR